MSDIIVVREQAEGFTEHGHSVSYTDGYIKLRKTFRYKALRLLKGAPLSVFCSVALADEPPDVQTICADTGYSPHAVCDALDFLVSRHYLEEQGRKGSRGVKVYRPVSYTWCGSDRNAPPDAENEDDSRIAKNAIRRRHDDMNEIPNHETLEDSFIHERQTESRAILEKLGIEGPNLVRLSAVVAPSVAQAWLDWSEQVDRTRWKNPAGFAAKRLLGHPQAEPPYSKKDEPKKRKAFIAGRLAEKVLRHDE